jgi:hypothetical protein
MNELPTSAMGVMRLLPDSKQGVQMFSMQLINAVKNGEVNALQLAALFKTIEKVIENVSPNIKASLLAEAERYPEKKFQAFGFEIAKTENGTKYNYESCGDPIWNHRKKVADEAIQQLKEREELLKSLREPLVLVDADGGSGEVATVRPPVKTSQSGLTFSLK